jgi:hypothetical protein
MLLSLVLPPSEPVRTSLKTLSSRLIKTAFFINSYLAKLDKSLHSLMFS